MKKFIVVDMFINDIKHEVGAMSVESYLDRTNRVLGEWEADYNVTISPVEAYGTKVYRIQGINKTMLGVWRTRWIEGKNPKPNTINQYTSAIRKFLHWCYEHDVILDDAAQPIHEDLSLVLHSVKVQQEDEIAEWNRPVRVVTAQNVEDIMARLGEMAFPKRNQCIAAAILFCGFRSTEVCNLEVRSVTAHRHENLIHCLRKGGKMCYTEASPEFYRYFDEMLEERKAYEESKGLPAYTEESPLFVNYKGEKMNRITVYKILAPVQKELELRTGGHALRAAFASEVERIGGVAVARDTLNHKSIRVTNRYVSTTHEQRLETISQLSYTPQRRIEG